MYNPEQLLAKSRGRATLLSEPKMIECVSTECSMKYGIIPWRTTVLPGNKVMYMQDIMGLVCFFKTAFLCVT